MTPGHVPKSAIMNPGMFLVARFKMQGFIISDHLNLWPEGLSALAGLVAAGKLKYQESVAEGLAAEGVDCLWVGHFDLSVSLGIPGEFDSPKFKQAIDRTIAAVKRHKKALGRLVPTVEQGIDLYSQGFDFVCYSGDVWVLHNALAEAIAKLRAGCAAKAEGQNQEARRAAGPTGSKKSAR